MKLMGLVFRGCSIPPISVRDSFQARCPPQTKKKQQKYDLYHYIDLTQPLFYGSWTPSG